MVTHAIYVYKTDGRLIFDKAYAPIELDPILVSSFFSAIQSFGKLMIGEKSESEIREITYGEYYLVFGIDDDLELTVVLMTDEIDKDYANKILLKILKFIKTDLGQIIASYNGNMDSIQGIEETIDQLTKFMPEKEEKEVKKPSLNLFQSLLSAINYHFLEETGGDVSKTNELILELGKEMAEPLLMEYADKIGEHTYEFTEFEDTLSLAYRIFSGRAFTHTEYNPETGVIRWEDANCPLCDELTLSEEHSGMRFCNIVAGIFTEIFRLRGFNGYCSEVECKAAGGKACVYEARELK